MGKKRKGKGEDRESGERTDRPVRADAQRNIDILLESAKTVFLASGVDAPVRDIAQKAGVGVGTVYRHFPQRSDLIVGVFRREIDMCADAAPALAKKYKPLEALAKWMQRYVDFIAAKRGLAAALHSGDPAYDALPAHFRKCLCPALQTLLEGAAAAGEIRAGVDPYELLLAVASLSSLSSQPALDVGPEQARRMVELLIDGLRYQGR